MTSFDALVWTWSVWGIALIVVCVLVAVGSWLSDRRASRRRLAAMPKPSAVSMMLGRAELLAAVRAERGERRVG